MSTDETDSPVNEKFLRDAFASEQECLAASLKSSFRITHNGDRGEVNEQFFIDFLRAYLPNRYTVEKAIVLDSLGQVSESIDVVVFDRQYTPTLLDNDKHRYVPAEAVYAVFECKPTIDKGYPRIRGRQDCFRPETPPNIGRHSPRWWSFQKEETVSNRWRHPCRRRRLGGWLRRILQKKSPDFNRG